MEEISDFARMRKESIVKRNNTNKRRSKEMERRIAKYLGGRRVPFSGAGDVKGDVLVNSKYGMCIIECKLSEAWNGYYDCPEIKLAFAWLDKLFTEVKHMGARFGALVFHYHNVREDYVMIEQDWLRILDPDYGGPIVMDKSTKTFSLPFKSLQEWLGVTKYIFVQSGTKMYAVMNITVFKDLITESED